MKLYQIQDIGGCRSVLPTVQLVKKCYNDYKKRKIAHALLWEKDYIQHPKSDGYRSIHLIYKFNSNKYKEYNGLLIEVQIRSRLQHLWATAVETAGCFTKQAIKSNQGDPNWSEFFRLVSSVFANIENTPTVPNTPSHEKELYDKIIKLESKLDVIERMTGWTASLNTMNKKFPRDIKFFL